MNSAISKELLDQVNTYFEQHLGLYFPMERRHDLEIGLNDATADFGFRDTESCARWLLLSPVTKHQIEILASHFTIGETYFFRDKKTFEILENDILPDIIHKRINTGRKLRIWSAGCSTGEEPYSIAILLRKLIPDIKDWDITILATDINPSFIRKAVKGVYGDWSFRDVPAWVKKYYFMKAAQGKYEILPDINKSVSFAYHNLAIDPYPSQLNNTNDMDIIFCRNVIMYFSRDHQLGVIQKLCRCLVEGGLFFGSPAEISAGYCSPLVQVHSPDATLYHKESKRITSPDYIVRPDLLQKFRLPLPFTPPAVEVEKIPVKVATPLPVKANEPEVARQPNLYQEALTSYERGQYSAAEEKINMLLPTGNDEAPALALLSRIRANQGRLAEARDLCTKAISIDKLNPGYHYLLATIQQELGLTKESIESFQRALYLDQNFVLVHFALGTDALRQGKTGKSGKHFENALSALQNYGHDDIIPESGGVTAGRMREIIMSTLRMETLI